MKHLKSPGVILGIIAVLLALGGTATAASGLITGNQIKNSSITGADVRDGSLSGSDIKTSSIGPSKLSDGLYNEIEDAKQRPLTPGPAGPAGPTGPTGPAGPSDLSGITVVTSAQVPFLSTDIVKSATAFCPAGQKVISGGGASVSDEQIAVTEATSDRTGWFVIGIDLADNGGEYVQAQALCAASGKAVAAAAPSRAKARAEVAALVKEFIEQHPAK